MKRHLKEIVPFLICLSSPQGLAAENRSFSDVPGVIICHAPIQEGRYIGSPSLAVLPSGEYIASHDFFGPKSGEYQKGVSEVYGSKDGGRTWQRRSVVSPCFYGRVFHHAGALWLLSVDRHYGGSFSRLPQRMREMIREGGAKPRENLLLIRRSTNGGATWTEPLDGHTGLLRKGRWGAAPTPVLKHNGRLWMVMGNGLLSAPQASNLLEADVWRYQSAPGSRKKWLDGQFEGWGEGSVVIDPEGRLVIVNKVRYLVPGDDFAAIVSLGKNGDTPAFDPDRDFVKMPGARIKFTTGYDPKSEQYWALTNYLPQKDYGPRTDLRRNTVALVRSPDLRTWNVQTVLLHHPDTEKHGMQYLDWDIEGEDLIALCRTAWPDGMDGPNRQHDANFLTFHRWEKFRRLGMEDFQVKRVGSPRLPKGTRPVILAWFWHKEEFEPGGYKTSLDLIAQHTGANLLATSLRVRDKEVTDPDVRWQIQQAAAYAAQNGMQIAIDLDVRLAREAFRDAYPEELQEMLRLREVPLTDSGSVSRSVESSDLSDHYTHRTTHYISLAGRLVRVYCYQRGPNGILPETVKDITDSHCEILAATNKEVHVKISCDETTRDRAACVMASFTHLTPDVFAPHLLSFQKEILQQYQDTGIVGVCKDEWGFPPCFDGCPEKNDYWFSEARSQLYAERTGGRDLLRDCLLMTYGEQGRSEERQGAINHFLGMSLQRNAAIEGHFYQCVKEFFGQEGVVATHPTWYPYPGLREFKKNGLDWWQAPRDLAQTDEMTPYAVRTSLAKKWDSGLWYNMYYHSDAKRYEKEIWSHALGGGRIDFHPVYPWRGDMLPHENYKALFRGQTMRGDCRIRLLNFISRAPLDCPVAVLFGHTCAMNWAGSSYDDVGLAITDGLWRVGYPADLIPTSEIGEATLRINKEGHLQYGPQVYQVAVLYHPEFEGSETSAFLRKVTAGKTTLYHVGEWTRDFEGRPLDESVGLPSGSIASSDASSCLASVLERLQALGVPAQTPASETLSGFGRTTCAPPAEGHCRLTDGTEIFLSGKEVVSGDRIQRKFEVRGHSILFDALGVAAVRLDKNGEIEAMAAGGLRRFRAGSLKIELQKRADVALWRHQDGRFRGVLQDWKGPVPESLRGLSDDWIRLAVPTPLDS